MTTMGFRPIFSALETTNLVCGSGPSAASTSTSAPSTMFRMRSTSPPKSAWPGVSTILMRVPFQSTEAALARIVMPRSRSRSLESMARSTTRWFSRYAPDCCKSRSTRVVLPWSTCAMMATLRRSIRVPETKSGPSEGARDSAAAQYSHENAGSNWGLARLRNEVKPRPASVSRVSRAGRPDPGPDPDALGQRVLQHHHLGDGLRRDQPDQLAGGIGDPDRRRRFLHQQLEGVLQAEAVADGR